MSEKLQKVLARAGLGSRREMESWIDEGRVSVNGELAHLGMRIEESDKIRVDGKPIKSEAAQGGRLRVLIYHKPVGEICSHNDPEGRPTIFDSLPVLPHGRWIAVGRLDYNTSGLMLICNNGEITNHLMHPSNEFEREYAVRVKGEVDEAMLRRLQKGVELEDGVAKFERIVDAGGEGTNHWYHVVLKEGRNREVRRMWESQEVVVSRLIRVRFGPVILPRGLRAGRWKEVQGFELKQLLRDLGLAQLAKTVTTFAKKDKPHTKVPRKARRLSKRR